jgi:hypothetical protein
MEFYAWVFLVCAVLAALAKWQQQQRIKRRTNSISTKRTARRGSARRRMLSGRGCSTAAAFT